MRLFSWALVQALRRHKVVWVVLFFSVGIKGLVNQIEQPFARSLVSCGTPLASDVYTGSLWCGDRFQVIQEGMYISGVGQGQEHFAMLCSLSFVIILTGVWGPKVALLLGLTGVTSSVGLFLLACTSPALGRSLFALGQGLQGLYPIEYLMGVLMLHSSMLPGADGGANFEVNQYLMLLSNIVWNVGLGSLVQLLELTNYTVIWAAVLALNVAILLLVALAFPAMSPIDAYKYKDVGPFTKVFREVWSYGSLVYDWRARRYLAHKVLENLVDQFHFLHGGFFMAWHGWSQPAVSSFFGALQIVNLLAMPIYPKLEQRFGNYNTFVGFIRYAFLARAVGAVCLPKTALVTQAYNVSLCLLSGFMAKRGFVDSRFVEPEQMQRFQSAQWVMGYFMGMWVSPFYATLFDGYASTFRQRMRPMLWYLAALLGNWIALVYGIWDIDGVEGCGVSLRVLDEGGHKGVHLWHLVSAPDGIITHEKWYIYDLESILGVPWAHTGAQDMGAIFAIDHFMAIVGGLNQTPKQGQEALRKLAVAIWKAEEVHRAYAEQQAREQEARGEHTPQATEPAPKPDAAEPAPEGKKDA